MQIGMRSKLVVWQADDDHILIFRETNLSAAVIEADGGQILQILTCQTTNGNVETCEGEVVLLLGVNAVVGAGSGVEDGPRIGSECSE